LLAFRELDEAFRLTEKVGRRPYSPSKPEGVAGEVVI